MPDSLHRSPRGLNATEAARRLQRDGANELAPPRRRTPWRIALEVAREPMFQLLLAAGIVYLVLGSLGEALMLLAFVAVTVAITVIQARRTEKSLEALRDLASPRALVLRDGETQRIPGRDVVRGDLLVLHEGDRVAADAWLVSASDLKLDESLLTGEALPVGKVSGVADPLPPTADGEPAADATPPKDIPEPTAARPGGDGQPYVYAGTLIVAGRGLARVLATGSQTEIGRIGKALDTIASPDTPLTLQTRRLVRLFSFLGVGLSLVVLLLYGLLRADWTGGLLAGITLAMSMLPEEFLLILTVFMAMGAWRLSQVRVLTRRAATIEALGAATVLCTDKTGTLTENRMAIAELWVPAPGGLRSWVSGSSEWPAEFNMLLEIGALASAPQAADPMDKALRAMARERLASAPGWREATLRHSYGLSADCLAVTQVWARPGATAQTVAVKGALEAVTTLCHLSPEASVPITRAAEGLAARGLRVLGVARASWDDSPWPGSPAGFQFTFQGLVALADPIRASVPAAVKACRTAGIRVVMITGDHPATARAIAAQAGLAADPGVMSGPELAALSDDELRQRVASITVFARVLPEQKLRIVQALQATGQVVAMTGDGVNDAPSLKAAHIGIAMGARGTDVAREASSLVLLDDDFGSIVGAIRLGRRIYDNLRKAMAFTVAVHVPIAGLSLLPLLFGLPLMFTPMHIAFLELLIDPVCAIVFEAEDDEADVMTRPPRDPAAPLFSRTLILSSLLQGGLVLAAVASFYVVLLGPLAVPAAEARAAAFTALVACSIALIIANRSFSGHLWAALRRPNPALWRMVAAASTLLAAVLLIPPLRTLFRFALPSPWWMALALGLALGVLLLIEALMRLWASRVGRLNA